MLVGGGRLVVVVVLGGRERLALAVDASVLGKLVTSVLVAGGGLLVAFVSGGVVPAGAVDASVLGKLVGTVDLGTVDVGIVDVGVVDVAPATDETGTTEFSWTALDDAPDCWASLLLRCGIKRGLALETSPRAVKSSKSDENEVCNFILERTGPPKHR